MIFPSWPLRGRTVLLVGGPVSAEARTHTDQTVTPLDDEADVRVEEAVMTLARGVFGRGGRLLAPEHPLLTPLLLEIVFEYWEALPGEESSESRDQRRFLDAPLLLYKGSRPQDGLDDVAGGVERAARVGCVRFVDGKELDSLRIALVVCVGGSGELTDELGSVGQVWRDVRYTERPAVYVIPTTGGAASRTAGAAREGVTVLDLEESIVRAVTARRKELRFKLPEEFRAIEDERARGREPFQEERPIEPEPIPDLQYAFYPLLIAAVLDEIK